MTELSHMQLLRRVDFSLVHPGITARELEAHCAIAREHRIAAVNVQSSWVEHARHFLDGSELKVAAAIGFPLGGMDSDTKRYETEVAVDNGAQEIDVVPNFGRLRSGDGPYVLRELRDVAEAADERPVKVIVDLSLLTEPELTLLCQIILDSGAHYVAACGKSVSPETLKELRQTVGETFGLQAWGITDYPTGVAAIEAGATRLGTTNLAALRQNPSETALGV
jgi:deoxyribose-phosphate aldolase